MGIGQDLLNEIASEHEQKETAVRDTSPAAVTNNGDIGQKMVDETSTPSQEELDTQAKERRNNAGKKTTDRLPGAGKGMKGLDNTRVEIGGSPNPYDVELKPQDDLSKKTGVRYVTHKYKGGVEDKSVGLVNIDNDKGVDAGIDTESPYGKLGNLRNEISQYTPAEDKEGIPTSPRNTMLGRYNFNLQHGWVMPHWNEEWSKNAEIENRARPSMLQAQGVKDARAAAMNERVMQRRRDSIKSSWDKTITQLDKGHYDQMADGTLDEEAVYNDLSRLARAYKEAGGNPDELTGFGLNRGGFAARTQKAKDIANDFIDMHNIRKQLRDDLADGSYGSYERRSAYDSVINRIQRIIGNAGGQQADADKVRVQYLYLPDWKVKEFQANYKAYMKKMREVTDVGGSSEARKLINDRLNEGLSSLNNGLIQGANIQTKAQGAFKAANALFNSNWQGLTAFGEAAQAVQAQWDAYVENMVREAIIDPRILDYQLQLAEKQARSRYANMVAQGGGRALTMGEENIPMDFSEYDRRAANERHYDIPFGSFDHRRLNRREGQEFATGNTGSSVGGR